MFGFAEQNLLPERRMQMDSERKGPGISTRHDCRDKRIVAPMGSLRWIVTLNFPNKHIFCKEKCMLHKRSSRADAGAWQSLATLSEFRGLWRYL